MTFLLDTNVVSELRKVDTGMVDARVERWAKNLDLESAFLSVITILELEQGTLLMERRDRRQGAMLRAWLESKVLPDFFRPNFEYRCSGRGAPRSPERARSLFLQGLADRSHRADPWHDSGHAQRLRFRVYRRISSEPVGGVTSAHCLTAARSSCAEFQPG